MPVANQYGIDMGNILSTVSDLKTAQQNRETNAIRKDILSRQNEEEVATNKAEQDYLKDPKTAVAQTIAQKIQWDKLGDDEKTRMAKTMKDHINQRGITINGIIGIQDPAQQKQAIIKAVAQLPEVEQKEVAVKYGSTPEDWQQSLPRMLNDLLVADGGVDLLQKQAETKTKHENALEEVGAKGAIEYGKEEIRQNALNKRANILADSREKVAETRERKNALGGSRSPKAKLLSYEIKTTTNPKTGEKTTVRINKWDDGTETTSAPNGELKPPPPLEKQSKKGATYKPSDVVKYGTKDGRKVAQMKDGSVIYVK